MHGLYIGSAATQLSSERKRVPVALRGRDPRAENETEVTAERDQYVTNQTSRNNNVENTTANAVCQQCDQTTENIISA
jgi:hypothetical protein